MRDPDIVVIREDAFDRRATRVSAADVVLDGDGDGDGVRIHVYEPVEMEFTLSELTGR